MNVKNQSSLKARLYVKLQGKKFLELGPLGLYHILSACLTVTLSSDSPDMVIYFQIYLRKTFVYFYLKFLGLKNSGNIGESQARLHLFRCGNGFAYN